MFLQLLAVDRITSRLASGIETQSDERVDYGLFVLSDDITERRLLTLDSPSSRLAPFAKNFYANRVQPPSTNQNLI